MVGAAVLGAAIVGFARRAFDARIVAVAILGIAVITGIAGRGWFGGLAALAQGHQVDAELAGQDGLGIGGQQGGIAAVVDRQIAGLAPHIGIAEGGFAARQLSLVPAAIGDTQQAGFARRADIDRGGAEFTQAELVQQRAIDDDEIARLLGDRLGPQAELGVDDGVELGRRFRSGEGLARELAAIDAAIFAEDVLAELLDRSAHARSHRAPPAGLRGRPADGRGRSCRPLVRR
jgi:hypothetical protein